MDTLIKCIFNEICDRMYIDLDVKRVIDLAYDKDTYKTAENISAILENYIANYFNYLKEC